MQHCFGVYCFAHVSIVLFRILGERSILDVRRKLEKASVHKLFDTNQEELEFWERLQNLCLLPQSTAYGQEEDLKGNVP